MSPPSSSNSKTSNSSTKKMATRSQTSQLSLQTMLGELTPFFGEELSQKTVHQKMSLQNFSETSASLLMGHYKITDAGIVNTTALAMYVVIIIIYIVIIIILRSNVGSNTTNTSYRNKFGNINSSLKSLQPFKEVMSLIFVGCACK